MGIIQLNQIKTRVVEAYQPRLDLTDAQNPEVAVCTRGLAAWVIEQLSGCSAEDAAASVTDGYQDNGLDAIWIDDDASVVYLVQTKWSQDGSGSTAVGDIHKFVQGFRDLVNAEFGRFNEKVRAKQAALEEALNDPNVTFTLVLAHTGTSPLSIEGRRVIDDLVAEVNDPIYTASFESLTQSQLHGFLKRGVRGARPNLRVTLHEWGHTQDPYAAYYGQVDAADVAEWYQNHGASLFEKNIREFLGKSSEVNSSLLDTLRSTPEHFWYLNNGITVLCEKVGKSAAGGNLKKSGTFDFTGVSVVNGAQTVGCIGEAAADDPSIVADARVIVRFISLENCPPGFASEVTRGTNTQNRVERRDFVALDKEQARLREDLLIDGVTYSIRSGEATPNPESGCSIVEATVALACAQSSPELAVQAKREIGRLWVGAESGESDTLYRKIFNSRTTSIELWRLVRVLRRIDEALRLEQAKRLGRDKQIGIHGNRILAHLVFQALTGLIAGGDDDDDFDTLLGAVPDLVATRYAALIDVIEESYASNYLASLFKNAARCADIVEACKHLLE